MSACEVADAIRVLIVDDEPLARENLLHLLRPQQGIEVVGECGDGAAAVAAIDELSPDLVFLDIQMPEIDGFGVLRRLRPGRQPEIVFVTAFDRYAVRAFEVHALDYLLKPVDRERFRDALQHARERLRRRAADGDAPPSWAGLVAPGDADPHVTRLAIRLNGRIRFVQTHEIDWIESADYYSRLHVGGRGYLIRKPMKWLERKLDPARFVRVHRGAIVQRDRVVELRRLAHGGYSVLLRDGTTVRLSRARREALESLVHGSRPAS